jgi:hypothetical protein
VPQCNLYPTRCFDEILAVGGGGGHTLNRTLRKFEIINSSNGSVTKHSKTVKSGFNCCTWCNYNYLIMWLTLCIHVYSTATDSLRS